MKTVEWALSSNVYEVNIRQYTTQGTFLAFADHLPRLKKMGVEIIWLMPITPISRIKRKGSLGSYYACSSYTSINPEFGTLADFSLLVDKAHGLGLKVIIDWVANHTGHDHEWTLQHPDFYIKNDNGNFFDKHGWDDVIDLEYSNHDLWNEMVNAMLYWVLTCNIDGFRCDMAHLVRLDFWKYARTVIDNKKKLLWIAETENIDYHEVFDASYSWKLLHAMEGIYNRSIGLHQLTEILQHYQFDFPQHALRLMFTSNHDENSHSGSEWERLGSSARAFAILCATWHNSIPLIYSGQEIPNYKRLLFFDKDELDWSKGIQLDSFYSKLLHLRRSNPALKAIKSQTKIIHTTAHHHILCYKKYHGENEVIVILNLSPEAITFNLLNVDMHYLLKEIFYGETFTTDAIYMLPWEYKVFAKV